MGTSLSLARTPAQVATAEPPTRQNPLLAANPIPSNPWLPRQTRLAKARLSDQGSDSLSPKLWKARCYGFFNGKKPQKNDLLDHIGNSVTKHALHLWMCRYNSLLYFKKRNKSTWRIIEAHQPTRDPRVAVRYRRMFEKDLWEIMRETYTDIDRIYYERLQELVKLNGGQKLWEEASPEDRAEFFEMIWDQDPYRMAVATNPVINQYVDFDSTYKLAPVTAEVEVGLKAAELNGTLEAYVAALDKTQMESLNAWYWQRHDNEKFVAVCKEFYGKKWLDVRLYCRCRGGILGSAEFTKGNEMFLGDEGDVPSRPFTPPIKKRKKEAEDEEDEEEEEITSEPAAKRMK